MCCSVCNTPDGNKWYAVYIAYVCDACRFHIYSQRGELFIDFFPPLIRYESFARHHSPPVDLAFRVHLANCHLGQIQQFLVGLEVHGFQPRMELCQYIGCNIVIRSLCRNDGIEHLQFRVHPACCSRIDNHPNTICVYQYLCSNRNIDFAYSGKQGNNRHAVYLSFMEFQHCFLGCPAPSMIGKNGANSLSLAHRIPTRILCPPFVSAPFLPLAYTIRFNSGCLPATTEKASSAISMLSAMSASVRAALMKWL